MQMYLLLELAHKLLQNNNKICENSTWNFTSWKVSTEQKPAYQMSTLQFDVYMRWEDMVSARHLHTVGHVVHGRYKLSLLWMMFLKNMMLIEIWKRIKELWQMRYCLLAHMDQTSLLSFPGGLYQNISRSSSYSPRVKKKTTGNSNIQLWTFNSLQTPWRRCWWCAAPWRASRTASLSAARGRLQPKSEHLSAWYGCLWYRNDNKVLQVSVSVCVTCS